MRIENPFKASDDKLLFAKALDRLTAYEKKHQATFTDFLNPVQAAAFMQVISLASAAGNRYKPKIETTSFGGYDGAEREMLGFGAEEPASFPITPIIITYNERFSKAPTHRDYLGAVLGLGLDRGKIGDIRMTEAGAIMYASSDIAPYIAEYLQQVGRVKVKTGIDPNKILPGIESIGQEKRITVASLRLDAVLSAALNLSRGKVAALIDSEKVFINWKPAKKTQNLSPGDNITVRGMGRIAINSEEGRTKKDRIVLTILQNTK